MLRPVSLRSGLTRADLIVGILAATVTVSVLIPGCYKARSRDDGRKDSNNIKQMCLAVHDCAAALDGVMPPSTGTLMGKPGTWFFHLLPYVERDEIWRRNATETAIRTYFTFRDPSYEETRPWTSYANNSAVFGVTPKDLARMPAAFGLKGTSQTIILMNRYAVAAGNVHAWADTGDGITYLDGPKTTIEIGIQPEQASDTAAQAFTTIGLTIGLADGTCMTLRPIINPQTFQWACDPKGDPKPPSDW
jgi:hypothetical protein